MPLFQERPALLQAFLEGDREALDEVYRFYRAPVQAYLRKLAAGGPLGVSRPVVLADLLQEVFLRAFSPRARSAYDPSRRYGPYLMTIARNCFIDDVNSRMRETALLELSFQRPWFGEGVCDPRDVGDQELRATVQCYLERLPPLLRAVYDRRFVSGEPQEIACAALGISRSKLRTAEGNLKRELRRALVRRELQTSCK